MGIVSILQRQKTRLGKVKSVFQTHATIEKLDFDLNLDLLGPKVQILSTKLEDIELSKNTQNTGLYVMPAK